ncbi:TonB-dependent receptor plug domain-containing protein [Sphingomonas baiyangensis]|uniref:TonB-dependent receptor plug domain-containing protein n=1 Tax=Sphingomonas baiyangensis TaxID=2572576 RepID=UPI001BB02F3A|nr:TonB-dependent receptor [Sphingomonas baiyangensis]
MLSAPAMAQDVPPAGAQDNQASSPILTPEELSETDSADQIIVTGTRIRSQQFDQPNPVVSVSGDLIQNTGATNITGFLADFPALTGSSDSNDNSGSNAGIGGVGLNLLDLRNLGTQRTLVLVDGRRHVSSVPGSASIDTNTIPLDLVVRTDIVTGGASSIYGADAVSGVVNFVLRQDFEGITARVQSGISDEGDTGNQFLAVTAGQNFAGGRGNIAVSLEYSQESRFLREQRRRLRPENFATFSDNVNDPDDDPNVPDQIPYYDVRYFDSNPIGAIDTNLDFTPDFIGNGSVFDPGTYAGGIFQSGGSGTPVATYGGELLPRIERFVSNLLFSYEVLPNIKAYVQGKYARVESDSEGQPTFDFTILTPLDNAFLPDNIRAQAIADAGNFGVLVNRDNLDIGRRGQNNKRETYRSVVGVRGDVTSNVEFDVSYVYGRSDARLLQTRTRFNDRFFAAIDAVDEGQVLNGTPNGNIVCRSNIAPASLSNQPFYNFQSAPFDFDAQQLSFTPGPNSGCVPFNLFSDQQAPGAIDFLLTDAVDTSRIQQHVVNAFVSGTIGDNIRLWGDAIGFAVGGEYRFEKSESFPDPVNTTGLTFGNALFPETGSFDVWEAFGELNVPIISNRPFAEELSINGAVRISDYSTIGTATTYSIGGIYAPIRDVRFRGTYARAVRAPNIGELFGPQNQTFSFIEDPCAPQNINDGTSTRVANCQAIFQQLGLNAQQIADFTGDVSSSLPGLAGGNPDLSEETATTWTAGVVLRPSFIPRLNVSVDFYDVRIEDAISTPALDRVAELCVDAPDLNNQFCDAIDRNPGTNPSAPGVVSGFRLLPQNVAEFTTRGIDFTVAYSLPTSSLGTFGVGIRGNYLDRLTFIAVPGGNTINSKGTVNAPEWQVNANVNWSIDKYLVTYRMNYFSKTSRFTNEQIAADPDIVAPEFLYFDERFTHDVQLAIAPNDRFSFYMGVNNVFNQEPDIGSTFYPVAATGRYIYAGARMSIDRLF